MTTERPYVSSDEQIGAEIEAEIQEMAAEVRAQEAYEAAKAAEQERMAAEANTALK
jgi:hypothetical protein